jgi:LPS sulfotransferase NodH
LVNAGLEILDFARWPRLEAFSHFQVEEIHARLGALPTGAWPRIDGCFVILFTARSGSTFLCRELEHAYDIGRMGEVLNPGQLKGRPVARIVRRRKNAWFAFKAGLQGVIAAELSGFFDVYLKKTQFIQLVRRDIVAQAVSFVKASQTRQWHLTDSVEQEPEYDPAAIGKAVRKLSSGVLDLRRYADLAGRPCITVVYEDFSDDDFTPALAACDALGLPRRVGGEVVKHRPVERMSDAVNLDWRDRFMACMDTQMRKRIDAYQASLQG